MQPKQEAAAGVPSETCSCTTKDSFYGLLPPQKRKFGNLKRPMGGPKRNKATHKKTQCVHEHVLQNPPAAASRLLGACWKAKTRIRIPQ
jgi:hypothetical protein